MPIAKVQLPDGRIGRFDVPEGTSPEQVLQFASQGLQQQAPSSGNLNPEQQKAWNDVMQNRPWGSGVGPAAYELGGKVTDATGSPVLGAAVNAVPEALQMALGGNAASSAKPLMQGAGRWLMGTAVKPTLDTLRTGDAARGIETMLREGINATRGGVEKMQSMVDALASQAKEAVANSAATVNKGEVGKRLLETLDTFRKQVNPQADMDAIRQAWLKFRNHPDLVGQTEMPVQLAQDLKQGTYTQLAKKYGEMGSSEVEAQKALARGLKDEIAKAVPQVAPLNARQSELINAIDVSQRRALMQSNNNPGGLAWIAHDPIAAAGFLADKSALLKSLLARGLYSGSSNVPALLGAGGGALYDPNQSQGALYRQ